MRGFPLQLSQFSDISRLGWNRFIVFKDGPRKNLVSQNYSVV